MFPTEDSPDPTLYELCLTLGITRDDINIFGGLKRTSETLGITCENINKVTYLI